MGYRKSLAATLCAGLALATTSITPALAHTDLVVVNFGGSAARAQMLGLIQPFEELTGKFVEMEEYNGGIEDIRRQVEAANVKWDVVDMEYSDLIQACDEGLLEPIDTASLPDAADGTAATEDFREGALHECGVGNVIWATVYAYEGDRFGDNGPTTIADFFDLETFPGKRGIREDPRGLLEWALMADGVPPGEVYQVLSQPEGLDRAFSVLEAIRSDIVWWSRGPDPARLLEDGTVSMSMAWNGRLYRPMVELGRDIRIVWDGQIWEYDLFAIPKGSRHLDTAREFIDYATSTEQLANWTNYISYGPSRVSSVASIPEEVEPHLPTAEANMTNALRYDSQWWAENIEAIRPRFNAFSTPLSIAEGAQTGRF